MKVNNHKRLLDELARHSDSPKGFIYGIMGLQNQSASDLAKNMGITKEHFYVLMNTLQKGNAFLPKTCVELAEGLHIDPYVLNTVVQNYRLTMYLNNRNEDDTEGKGN